jgi:hypothetical protein
VKNFLVFILIIVCLVLLSNLIRSITSFKCYFKQKGIYGNGTQWFENFDPEFPDQHLNSNTEIPFDFESIMNYPDDWMSNGNGPTMVPKDPNVKFNISQNRLSKLDVASVRKMYDCTGSIVIG